MYFSWLILLNDFLSLSLFNKRNKVDSFCLCNFFCSFFLSLNFKVDLHDSIRVLWVLSFYLLFLQCYLIGFLLFLLLFSWTSSPSLCFSYWFSLSLSTFAFFFQTKLQAPNCLDWLHFSSFLFQCSVFNCVLVCSLSLLLLCVESTRLLLETNKQTNKPRENHWLFHHHLNSMRFATNFSTHFIIYTAKSYIENYQVSNFIHWSVNISPIKNILRLNNEMEIKTTVEWCCYAKMFFINNRCCYWSNCDFSFCVPSDKQ